MLSTLGLCLDARGTGFYNKIVGAVKCSTLELKKLELVLYLLNRKDDNHALELIDSSARILKKNINQSLNKIEVYYCCCN
jgi:hypothetical protein